MAMRQRRPSAKAPLSEGVVLKKGVVVRVRQDLNLETAA
jgi:hypothetical protein